jgi:hypothetical protein
VSSSRVDWDDFFRAGDEVAERVRGELPIRTTCVRCGGPWLEHFDHDDGVCIGCTSADGDAAIGEAVRKAVDAAFRDSFGGVTTVDRTNEPRDKIEALRRLARDLGTTEHERRAAALAANALERKAGRP